MRKIKVDEMDRLSPEAFKQHRKLPVVLVLDNVRSMNNVGSVFRTADAFLFQAIYLCGITACPPHRDIHKTALGAEESMDWVYYPKTIDAVQQLREEGYKIYSLEQVEPSIPLQTFAEQLHPDAKVAVVLGHEVKGVTQEVLDVSDAGVEIPQYGTKHSFNVSVAAGMVSWEIAKAFLL